MDLKKKASITAIVLASFLSVSKFIIGFASGSMAVLTSGLDSLLDIFMSSINFLAIRKADMPPDRNHLYGHGKVEDLSAILQSVFILISGSVVIYKSVDRFIKNTPINYSYFDLLVMGLSIFVSFFISRFLYKVGKKTNSKALQADALHYSSDLYSNSGVFLSIIVSYITGKTYFDYLIAIVIGGVIFFSAFKILKQGIYGLTDISLSEDLKRKIDQIIEEMPMPYAGYHKLRTRSSGSKRFIDFHLLVCRKASIDEAHEMANMVEQKILETIGDVDVLIHIEPCPYTCDMTEDTCRVLKMRKNKEDER